MPDSALTFADVDAGRITLRTPFSNLLLCKRVPNAAWDRARRLWTYPATPQHARLIRASIPRLSVTEKFMSLLKGRRKPPHRLSCRRIPSLSRGPPSIFGRPEDETPGGIRLTRSSSPWSAWCGARAPPFLPSKWALARRWWR